MTALAARSGTGAARGNPHHDAQGHFTDAGHEGHAGEHSAHPGRRRREARRLKRKAHGARARARRLGRKQAGLSRRHRLESLAKRAQAHHERHKGTQAGRVHKIDRAIAVKRAAHAARQAESHQIRSRRAAGKPGRAESKAKPAAAPKAPEKAATKAEGRNTPERQRTAERLKRERSRAGPKVDPSSHTNHAPGTVTDLDTRQIHFDPERFQYKLAHGAETGSVGSLAGVRRWDPELAGVVQVWKDPGNGKVYVVNGHNRLDLAKKIGVEKVTTRFLDAKDAAEARSKGALTNIAEGRGNSLDAAKFFKDSSISRADLEARGIPMREKIATEGLALSNLESGLFRKVIDGHIPVERATIIGGSGLDHPQQKALHELVEGLPKNRAVNNETLRELTDTVKSSGHHKSEGFDLFGSRAEDQSLALHKAKLQADIKGRLSREKKLFGVVSRSRAAQDLERAGNVINAEASAKVSHEAATTLLVFDQFKNLRGPVSRSLNRASERIAAGESVKRVTDETYADIVRDLPGLLTGGQEFAP